MTYKDGVIYKANGDVYPFVSKPSGHRVVSVWHDGKTKKLQYARVVWVLVNGDFPEKEIDHIDCNPANNDISNLRLASRTQNNWNKSLTDANGVYKHGNTWRAEITVNGIKHRVSKFSTKELAVEFRNLMSAMLHGEFARIK